MAGNENMSIEEVLAACRAQDGGGAAAESTGGPAAAAGDSTASSETASSETASSETASSETGSSEKGSSEKGNKRAAAASAGGKKPGQMSVAEMMAAARAEKATGPAQPAKPAQKKPAQKKPASPAGAAQASPKPSAAARSGGPKETTSILAAARAASKPGPITKAEAARRSRVEPPTKGKPKLEVPPMPAKPEYALPRQSAAGDDDRRGFLASLAGVFVGSSLAVGFSSLAITHVLWALGLARFMFPNILTEPPTQFKVGFPDALAPGQVETKFKAQFGVWVVRADYDGVPQIFALQSVCTHLGCTPNWLEGEQKFKCPCHGSGFYKDGINFEGPAPRPLERFAIRLADDGQLEVDKSRKFKQEIGQWKDGASFVPV